MTVYFEDEATLPFGFHLEEQAARIISAVRDYVHCPYDVEVSVTMVDKASIQGMNLEFRQMDKPTDVLSFPMAEYDKPGDFSGKAFQESKVLAPDTGELVLGDIVLCSDIIREQAAEYGHSELREFSFLVVHSMLHLFGYDHIQENDRLRMEKEQRAIMDTLGVHRTSGGNGGIHGQK